MKTISKTILKKANIIYKICKKETIYLIKIKHMSEIANWDCNRIPDSKRIDEIYKWIIDNEQIPGILSLTELDNKLYCYDGGHRLQAIKNINSSNIKKTYKCLIHVLHESNSEETYKRFNDLNKLIELPDIYKKLNTYKISYIINKCIDKLITDNGWNSLHRSTCNRPRTPYFNKSKLIDIFHEFLETKNYDNIDNLYNDIMKVNDTYKQEIELVKPDTLSTYMLKKRLKKYNMTKVKLQLCRKYNCYVTLVDNFLNDIL
jgi:hypothetical protein